jgi:hypothetical protein
LHAPPLNRRLFTPCAEHFSTFIVCQVWDHTNISDKRDERILLQAQAAPLKDADLAFLRKRFEQAPTTHGWPGDNQYVRPA